MDINFACQHCGKKLVADQTDIGQSVPCPACGNLIVVPSPQPPASAGKQQEAAEKKKEAPRKRIVMHVPAAGKLESKATMTAAGKKPPEEGETPAGTPLSSRDGRVLEIVVGWICIVVGIVVEILLPNALPAYLPFFIGALIMAIILLRHGKVAHGLVMILCTIIPAPLLMHHNVWQGARSPPAERKSDTEGPRKLVFDAGGQPKLVADDRPVARRAPPQRDVDAARAEYQSLEAWKAARRPPARKESAAMQEEATTPQPPTTPGVQDPRDPYRDLLEGAEDIPPLIPEEDMAKLWSSHEQGFRWQEDRPEAALLPGDPAWVADIPFVIYSETEGIQTYIPSGYMGNQDSLSIDDNWNVDPHSGRTCIRVAYADTFDWVAVAWQHPPNNWGDMPGGYDFSKASKLTFWAKGESGREDVEFKVGMEQPLNAMTRDSLQASTGVVRLRDKWRKYSIPLEKLDRSRIISGFIFRIEGQGHPVLFYLDEIQFE